MTPSRRRGNSVLQIPSRIKFNMKRPGGGIASRSKDSVTAAAEARAALARRTAPRQQLPGPQNFHYYYDGDASASEEHSLVPSQVQVTARLP